MTEYGRRDMLWLPLAAAMLAGCRRRKRDPETVVIGSSPTGVPFSFVDPWTNELTGSMVDAATAVVRDAGFKTETAITPFSALIPSLAAGKIDMIAAAMLRTPERERVVAFSDPIYHYAGALIVRGDDKRIVTNLGQIGTTRVGAQIGSRFIDQLHAAGARNVSTYESLVDIMRDLENGRIDIGYGDEPILRYQLRVGWRRNVRIVEQFRAPALEELCLVMRLDDARLTKINLAIARLTARNIPAINRKWGL
ncbi:ABC transporter substrate-binding protein [Sphingopyxis sp. JAI128]|uniref:ABC transporter substrate-binding protein n=1 Tax=Sphingopyxis sp. JAI128 TaxID=2723066 RepID=UPI00160BF535|nr:ABC transporter substrate-binding protein [Sphingopyxis sp. JAI128]MBB6427156.1 polar amino acid transport system substrate-binding protein [Sphingopyxis sp. JAI128]